MEAAFGARPTVTYYDNHVVVDNEAGKVRVEIMTSGPRASNSLMSERDARGPEEPESGREHMQKRRLGRTGLEVSVLGYGAGAVGGLFTKGAAADQERAVARAIDAGINYFDTASLYGNGESERNLGRVLKALKADVVVGTKVRLTAAHRADVGKAIAQGMDDSLKRMGRDHVDLFQLHNPLVAKDADDHLAIEIALNEVVPALEKLKKAGKTRFIGFSGVGETAALHQGHRFQALRHDAGRLQRAQSQRRRADAQGRARARITAACSTRRRPPTWARSSSARWPAARCPAPPTAIRWPCRRSTDRLGAGFRRRRRARQGARAAGARKRSPAA